MNIRELQNFKRHTFFLRNICNSVDIFDFCVHFRSIFVIFGFVVFNGAERAFELFVNLFVAYFDHVSFIVQNLRNNDVFSSTLP